MLPPLLMEWHPIERSTESHFSEAATAKMLEEWLKHGDIKAIYNAALLLNTMLHQQRTITQWLAREAAMNLGRPELSDEMLQSAIIKSNDAP
jgi:hypothetical protein